MTCPHGWALHDLRCKCGEPYPLAELLFAAAGTLATAEERLMLAIDAVFGDDWDDYTFDYYDRSIEISGVGEAIDCGQLKLQPIWDAGFSLCWLHSGKKCESNQKLYGAPVAPDGPAF